MRLLSIEAVADLLGVARARAYELVRLRLIPGVRLGRQVRVEEGALRDWVARGGRGLDQPTDSERGERP